MSAFSTGDKSEWDLRMMIRQPDAVEADLIRRLAEEVAAKKALPVARGLGLVQFEEGAAAQVLHVGPYASEAPTIRRLHEFLHTQGVTFDGQVHKHHVIYLSDPRRTAPERLRTIHPAALRRRISPHPEEQLGFALNRRRVRLTAPTQQIGPQDRWPLGRRHCDQPHDLPLASTDHHQPASRSDVADPVQSTSIRGKDE